MKIQASKSRAKVHQNITIHDVVGICGLKFVAFYYILLLRCS